MGRFRIQLVSDGISQTQSSMEKTSVYSSSLTEWTILNSDFTETKYGKKLVSDQIGNPLGDM